MLGSTLACVVGGVVVWRLLAPAGRMEVQLIFICYTNTPPITQPAALPSVVVTLQIPEALLLATNTGAVPVQLWSAIRLPNLTNTPQFARANGRGLPAVLNPGESVTVSVRYPLNARSWQTELMYQRHNFADRLYGRAWNTGSRTVQDLMESLLDPPKVGWAQSGWITNPPPLFAASGFLWAGARAFRPIDQPGRWVPYVGSIRDINERMVLKHSDIIDASGPPGRYHISAPPDWSGIDFSDLSSRRL